jgi:hypothetical protein
LDLVGGRRVARRVLVLAGWRRQRAAAGYFFAFIPPLIQSVETAPSGGWTRSAG